MSAQLLDLPITNSRQIRMVVDDMVPDRDMQATIMLAMFEGWPPEFRYSVLNHLNRLYHSPVPEPATLNDGA